MVMYVFMAVVINSFAVWCVLGCLLSDNCFTRVRCRGSILNLAGDASRAKCEFGHPFVSSSSSLSVFLPIIIVIAIVGLIIVFLVPMLFLLSILHISFTPLIR